MPDIIAHYRLGDAVFHGLQPPLGNALDRGVFDHATAGPDVWFSYRFWLPGAQQGKPARGHEMQHRDTGAFLLALAEEAKAGGDAKLALFSYLAGFLCHYALDQVAHPYVIYRSGIYDGTPVTLPFRGNHMRLEHALDLRAMEAWGLRLGQRPITRRLLRLKQLPPCLRPGLNAAYERVYGWRDAWADLNRAIKDQRRFYRLAQDPCGLLDGLLRLADNGTGSLDVTAISYYGKALPQVDVENRAQLPWQHPYDPSLVSRQSFAELTQQAAEKACAMIAAAWAYLADGQAQPLRAALGNASYATGFDCRDPRNHQKPSFDPLPLKRYQR